MRTLTKTLTASALAVAGMGLAVPASAAPMVDVGFQSALVETAPWSVNSFERVSAHWDDDDDDDRRYGRRYRDERVYRNTRVWRGRDGQLRCRKTDGTIGLIVGGAAGAILGREIDSRGDRSLGTILGAAGGAILGKQVMSRTRCR